MRFCVQRIRVSRSQQTLSAVLTVYGLCVRSAQCRRSGICCCPGLLPHTFHATVCFVCFFTTRTTRDGNYNSSLFWCHTYFAIDWILLLLFTFYVPTFESAILTGNEWISCKIILQFSKVNKINLLNLNKEC